MVDNPCSRRARVGVLRASTLLAAGLVVGCGRSDGSDLPPADAAHWMEATCGIRFREMPQVLRSSVARSAASGSPASVVLTVVLPDKREFPAVLVGIDDVHDVAKLKITGSNLPVAKLGSAKNLLIGEWAIALGNPYGFMMSDPKPTVSVGVISALNRSFEPQEGRSYRSMIQTDAAVNPGNSGGPLVNIKGEVIGINTFIVSETGGNIGIGFAIPVDQVVSILSRL